MNLLEDLEFRELIYQVTDRDSLAKRLSAGPITLYIGFDPTADSLHIGNLLQVLLLRRFQLQGHKPIAVVGGGTGLIGDPSGKTNERQLNPAEIVEEWSQKFFSQMERYLDFNASSNAAQTLNNYSWLGGCELIPFLRDIGKHFSIGPMLAKDSVKSRLQAGISYTEFSYMILQAYDYLHLHEHYGCELQAGGSDQWGNITTGIDLIRRKSGTTVHGLTLPLVTKSGGGKLGKTESGTIWLDPARTTPYQFYQYWMNVEDSDVIRFLKFFTFLTTNELNELAFEVKEQPWKREAQRTLARLVTQLVHGEKATTSAENISKALFSGKVSELTSSEIEQGLNDVPTFQLKSEQPVKLVDVLAEAQISPSKRRAREDILNGAITVNDNRQTDIDFVLQRRDRVGGKYIIIRRGKNKYHLINWKG